MSLTSARRSNEQQARLGEAGIVPPVAANREHHTGQLGALYRVVGENEIIDRRVLIEGRDVSAIQNALLAALTGALAPSQRPRVPRAPRSSIPSRRILRKLQPRSYRVVTAYSVTTSRPVFPYSVHPAIFSAARNNRESPWRPSGSVRSKRPARWAKAGSRPSRAWR
jgi:hypothetical protein